MSAPITLPDLIKSFPAVSDASGKSLLLTDANGNLSRFAYPEHLKVVNLSGKEVAGKVLVLKNFTTKYITGLTEGTMLTNKDYAHSTTWYLNLKEGVTVDLQTVMIIVAKNRNSLSHAWANISLIILPSSTEETAIYFVTQATGSTADAYNLVVRKIASQAI